MSNLVAKSWEVVYIFPETITFWLVQPLHLQLPMCSGYEFLVHSTGVSNYTSSETPHSLKEK